MKWKGKDIRGFLHRATDVLFDKIGTNYTNDNVDGVLREIDNNLSNKPEIIEKTYAEYLADKAALDASGNIIKITDAGLTNSASGVSYDNTDDWITSGNAQGAIHEVAINLPDEFIVDTVTSASVTVGGNNSLSITANASKTGYDVVGILGISAFSSKIAYGEYGLYSANQVRAYAINLDSSSATGQVTFTVLYKKHRS